MIFKDGFKICLLRNSRASVCNLQAFQKRILCQFLGVNNNARNDIIEAISNSQSMFVRQNLLGHRRQLKLE